MATGTRQLTMDRDATALKNNEKLMPNKQEKVNIEIIVKGNDRYFKRTYSEKEYLIKQKPACVDSEDVWEDWLKQSILSKNPDVYDYCGDCINDCKDAEETSV